MRAGRWVSGCRPAPQVDGPGPRRARRRAAFRPRALPLPPSEPELSARARLYARRLADMRRRELALHLGAWQTRACDAMLDYACAEQGLRELAPGSGDRSRMAYIQWALRAAGDVQGVVEDRPAAGQPYLYDVQSFLLRLGRRQSLLAAHLCEPDVGWHVSNHPIGAAGRLASTLSAAHSWQPPASLMHPLSRLSALLAGQHRLAAGKACLPSGALALRRPLLFVQRWLVRMEYPYLAEARAMLNHDGRITHGRAVFLWRRELGPLAESLLATLEAESLALPLRYSRLSLELAWETEPTWLHQHVQAMLRALGRQDLGRQDLDQ